MQAQAEQTLETPALTVGASPPLQWYCLNDIVMGGQSSSQVTLSSEGALKFSGNISTVGGGFAGCRTTDQEYHVPSGVQGVWLTASGQHTHSVKFTMRAGSEADAQDDTGETIGVMDLDTRGVRANKGSGKGKPSMKERWADMSVQERKEMLGRISWQCSFSEHLAAPGADGSEPRRFFLPLSSFSASLYGQALPKLQALDLATLHHIGLTVGVFDAASKARLSQYADGPFELTLHHIEFGDASAC